jgi:hypothetical protein
MASAKAKVGMKGAMLAARHPMLRRATLRAAKPTARVGWKAGKAVAKRRFSTQLEVIDGVARTVGETVVLLVTYGPELAEALGLVEPPKRRKTGRAVVVGVAIGGGAVYLSSPERRRQLRQLLGSPPPDPPN